jgi:ribonuclease HI
MLPNSIQNELYKLNQAAITNTDKVQSTPVDAQSNKVVHTWERVQTDLQTIQRIQDIQQKIKSWKRVEIYTDGSLDRDQNYKTTMGIGIIFVNPETNTTITFSGKTIEWPSSTTAELTAILTALVIVGTNKAFNLFTDSQVALQVIKRKQLEKKQLITTTSHITVIHILEILAETTEPFTLNKIQAHTGNTYNEIADKLADQGREQTNGCTIQVSPNNTKQLWATLAWRNRCLNTNLKSFLKVSTRSKWASKWASQNRNYSWLDKQEAAHIDWQHSWYSLHPSSMTNHVTNEQDQQLRRRMYKQLNQEFPTATELHKRRPDIYVNNLCAECKSPEDMDHILTKHMGKINIYNEYIKSVIHEITSRTHKKIQTNLDSEV